MAPDSVPGTTYGGPGNPVEPAGVGTAAAMQTAATNPQLCAQGYHAWVPWLRLDSGGYVTWCARGCGHEEQYDDG